jgi:tetratricopeptide (TPR) repeat protein
MTIRTSAGAGLAALVMLVPTLAKAQTAQTPPQAEQLNEDGKTAYKNKDYATATAKFQAAIAISPEARFYFNLCASDEKLGDYDGALTACDEVYTHTPTDELKGKTGERAAEIRAKKKKRDQDLAAKGGGTTNTNPNPNGTGGNTNPNPNGTGGNTNPNPNGTGSAVNHAPPPDESVEAVVEPGLNYKWGFGGSIGPTFGRSLGGGILDYANKSGAMVHLAADYLLWPKRRYGVQLYLDILEFQGAQDPATGFSGTMSMEEVGLAVYKHFKLANKLWFSPHLGAHIVGIQPYQAANVLSTVGIRAELPIDWVLASNSIITFAFSYNLYLPSTKVSGDIDPANYGFDHGGGIAMFTIGYTYRTSKLLPGVVVLE